LRKLEEINRLSRRLSAEKNMSADDLIEDLNAIDNKNDYAALPRLFAYFLGAGSFAFALGSSWQDSLVSAVTGLLIGVSL
ncbi:threonine/serine exporter family protein, partial [Streptococcus pyogenes]